MVKQLLKSVREFKKDALLTPFFVVLEVVMEVVIPFIMAELIDKGIDAQIDVSELMGSELHLHMTAGGKDVVAVVQTANLDPNAYARHTAVRFSFEPRLIHLFDPKTEKNLI